MSEKKKFDTSSDLVTTEPPIEAVGFEDPKKHDAVFGEITEDGPNYRNVDIEPRFPSL